uniref:Uncharacterized mitochondrial protein AtMg00810-like n=1 Tax=Tanacetum cinerariifolium TaxID=118510 RepID=A0A6L2K143_TANCI|nr:uncharacterized mitochondrial protein AtMg00810-like [Tanacetum cinerariifolium]
MPTLPPDVTTMPDVTTTPDATSSCLPPSLPISHRNNRLPPALPYFILIIICCQLPLPYQYDARDSATASIVSAVCQDNDHGFGRIRVPKQKRNTGTKEMKIVDNCKKGLGYENYNAVLPPYTRNFMPPTPDLSFTGFDEFVNEPIVENCKALSSEEEPKAEAISTACYMQKKVLVDKPHNKTPYEFFHGRTPTLSFMRTFKCPVTILNTIDQLGKFKGKADECFFVRYSLNSKAFRLFNSRTRIVEENLHIRFSKSTPNIVGSEPDWLFDIDALTRIMNYEPIVADPKSSHDDGFKPFSDDEKKELCIAFEKFTHEKFQMSYMGELTFFLGLQVKLKKDGIFVSQDKYVAKILKKFRSMIGSLMYLTSSRPDIMFAVCAYARYQVNLKVLHLYDVKRIFMYLKGQPIGPWYPKDYPFDLVAYTNSSYAGASLDMKSTTGGCQFLGLLLVILNTAEFLLLVILNTVRKSKEKCYIDDRKAVWNGIGVNAGDSKGEGDRENEQCLARKRGSAIPTDPHHTPTIIQPSTQPKKKQQPRKPKRKDTQIPQPSDPIENLPDKAIHEELGDSLVRAATTASSIEAEKDSANIDAAQDSVAGIEKGIDIQELGKSAPTKSSQQSQDKGRGILIEPMIEPMNPMKRKDQLRLDEKAALKLQAAIDEEERLAREKAEKVKEANIALIETWDDIHAKIDVDHQLIKRMQA